MQEIFISVNNKIKSVINIYNIFVLKVLIPKLASS
jgi:hypothetical protein